MESLNSLNITPDSVKEMKHPTNKLLCYLKDNHYISFGEYTIKDYESG